MSALGELFESLALPQVALGGAAHFSAQPVPGYEIHRIGKDPHGAPCLLLRLADGAGSATPPPTVLSHLAVQYDVQCRIFRPEQPPEESAFTLIRCLSTDGPLVARFLDVMEVVVRTVGRTPTTDHVRHAVEDLAELFRSLDRLPRKSAQGVWAELFLMARAEDVGRLAAAWHAFSGEAFDFSEGSDRIEVKATSGGAREHYFSLAQVYPARGVRVLVASLLVEALSGGMSVKSLLRTLRGRLAVHPELILRVESIAAQSFGNAWTSGLEESFDWQRAEESLRFFEPHAIPAVPKELPREVSDVRFRSDLSRSASLDVSEARQRAGLFAAL